MKNYKTSEIRNIVVLGSSGCGKTTLMEAVAFITGEKSRLGSIMEGNTISDFDKEEVTRRFSIHTSIISLEWKEFKINFLDTPGAPDFSGERMEAVSVADAAIIVVNGRKALEEGTFYAWNLCNQYSLPRIVFVTGMDDDAASFRGVVEGLKERFGSVVAPFSMPVRKDQQLLGYADVITMTARQYAGVGKYEPMEVPDYCMDNLNSYRVTLDEAIASSDENKMEKYFAGEVFTEEEIRDGLRANCLDLSIVPVLMGSGLLVYGIDLLLNDIIEYMPQPQNAKIGTNKRTDQDVQCKYDKNGFLAAQVFKTISDPYIGRYSFVKVFSGELKSDTIVYNSANDTQQRIGRLFFINGQKFVPTEQITAGDIGAIPKLSDVATSDTLSQKENPVIFSPIAFEIPYTVKRYDTVNKKDDDKVYGALLKLLDEDRTIQLKNDMKNGQQLIIGIGEQQLNLLADRLRNQYKIEIKLSSPAIAYRETILREAQARGRFKKQTGGHGQFGDVLMTFGPSGNRKKVYEFEQRIVGGAVPKNYIPAVEKGVEESVKAGYLAGYPIIGIKAVLLDGSYHPVDSCENAFRMASIIAFKDAYKRAEPVLLEPVATVKICSASEHTGDIVSDLKTRRARVMGISPVNQYQSCIEADIPMAEMDGYLTRLRSICGGYVSMSYEFARYSQTPDQITAKEIEKFHRSLKQI